MKYVLLFCLLGGLAKLWAQPPIVYGESFFDTDPGYGQAAVFPAFSADTTIDLNITPDLSTLVPGLHVWHVRVRDSLGVWSQTLSRPVLVLFPDQLPIDQGEWFWDVDPGEGQGEAMIFAPGDSIDLTWNIDLTGLTPGLHQLYLRMRDAEGRWSHSLHRNTIVHALPDSPIDKLTYFYQSTDSQTVTYTYLLAQPQHYIDLSFDPNTSDLPDSTTYDFCITAETANGLRSFEQCVTFEWLGDTTTVINPTGIAAADPGLALRIYPNPTADLLQIDLAPGGAAPLHLTLASASGQTLQRHQLPPGNPHYELYLSAYPPGVYLLILEQGMQVSAHRVVRR